jgi:NAD+ synthase (glutamine-hydrolysing)
VPRVRVGLAQMNPTVGALRANAAAVRAVWRQAEALGVDLVVTPELMISGYPPEDLLLKSGFLAACADALDELVKEPGGTALCVGVPLRADDDVVLSAPTDARATERGDAPGVANAVAVLAGGRRVAVATKRLLPNYDVFDEQRYFAAGQGPLCVLSVGGAAVGVLVCEDVWTADGPIAALAARGVSLVVVSNASPYARGRQEEREEMARAQARRHRCAIAYVNLVGGQDELVFDGRSFVVDATGEVVARAPAFGDHLLVVDLDLAVHDVPGAPALVAHESTVEIPSTLTASPSGCDEIYGALKLGTRDYLSKNGFSRAVLGLSGGIDSALVATIAADALGPDHVAAYALPSRYSSEHSLADAREVATRLGIAFRELPIDAVHRAVSATLVPALHDEPHGLTDENMQSRIRALVWMAISNATGAIVLTTGNKSELATGYFTLFGDSAGGFAPIKDVPKTLVYELCRWRNEVARTHGGVGPIPEHVLAKAPSAELRPDQRDSDSLPPYEELDPLLERYVEGDATAEQLVAEGHDEALVTRVVALVDGSEFKRRQLPPGPRITRKAFGKDRRLPITNQFRYDHR